MIPRVLLALAVLLATHPTIVHAGHCGQAVRVQKQAVYAAPVVQHHVQQQVYGHAYQQQVVLKQVGYVPQYYTVGAELREEALAERIAIKALERIENSINEATERFGRRDEPRGGFTHPGQTVAQHNCATCHTKGSAKVEAGAPVLFDGLGKWLGSDDEAKLAIDMANAGTMPPKTEGSPPRLEDQDFYAFKAYLTEATSPIGK